MPLNGLQAQSVHSEMVLVVDGISLIDHRTMLGRRQAIAGVEHALIGMKAGGYRKIRISPHLAYRDQGIPDQIPPDAVLLVEIWLREVMV